MNPMALSLIIKKGWKVGKSGREYKEKYTKRQQKQRDKRAWLKQKPEPNKKAA